MEIGFPDSDDSVTNFVVLSDSGDVLAQGFAKVSGNAGSVAAMENALTANLADDVKAAVEDRLRIEKLGPRIP